MDKSSPDHHIHNQESVEMSSSSTVSSEDGIKSYPSFSGSYTPASFSSYTHFPTGVSCKYDIDLQKALNTSAVPARAELSIFDMRTQSNMIGPQKITVSCDLSSTNNVLFEVAEKLNLHGNKDVYYCLNARSEASLCPFVVVRPAANSLDTLTIILHCRFFDQHDNDEQYCLRINKELNISMIKEIIRTKLGWKGLELYITDSHMSNNSMLKDFDVHDFSSIVAVKSVSKMVTFLHKPTANIRTQFRINIHTSDSVKAVKQIILNQCRSLQEFVIEKHQCLHITCSNELLENKQCFGMTSKFHRENMYQIHFARADAIVCSLVYQSGKERLRNPERTILLVSPNCSTAELREAAAKHMKVEPKAVKLETENKIRIEEMPDISPMNAIYDRCTIYAGIKNKKTFLVKHPASDKPEKVASLYTLEPVSTLRKLVAKKYGIDELQIVLKHKGITLEDKKLICNYPVKSNMVLDLHLFDRRTNIIAYVTFKKRKLALIIDDCEKTTVGDILRYCAMKLEYRSSCSRCVYEGRCLDQMNSVKTAGIIRGSVLVILYFDEDEQLNGGLQRIFMVEMDGRVISRYGSVAGGLLLYASKNAQLMQSTGIVGIESLPEGVHECAFSGPRLQTQEPRVDLPLLMSRRIRNPYSLKKQFLTKARTLIDRKYGKGRSNLRNADQLLEKRITDAKTVWQAKNTENVSRIIETGNATFTKEKANNTRLETSGMNKTTHQKPEFYLEEDDCYPPSAESLRDRCLSLDDEEKSVDFVPYVVSENNDKQFKSQSESTEQNDINCNDSRFSQVLENPCSRISVGRINSSSEEWTIIIKTISQLRRSNTIHREALCEDIVNSGTSSDSGLRMDIDETAEYRIMKHQPRRRTESENTKVLPYGSRALHGNRLLTTAGITMPLLDYVSSQIGTHWKQLARKLGIDEIDLEELEHKKCSLRETCYQCLLLWKRTCGPNASKDNLIKALRDINMTSLAEECVTFVESGYQTA